MRNWTASFRAISKYSMVQKRFYRKSLIIIVLAICFPTFIVGSGVKWIGTKQLENSVLFARDHQVAQSAQRVDDYLSYLEKAATQWAFNPEFGVKLKSLETSYDYEFIRSVYTNLLLLKESNPLIADVYIYLDRPGIVLSDSNGTITLHEQDQTRFHELLSNRQSAFWSPSYSTINKSSGKAMLTLAYQLPAESAEPFGVLLVYLKSNQVSQMLNGLNLDENGATFLFNEAGEHIGSSNETPKSSQQQQDLAHLVKSRGEAKGSFIYEYVGATYSVSFTSFKRLGQQWTYVTMDSLDKLNSPVIAASHFVYLIGLAGLLFGIITAIIVSRKLYQPILVLMKMFKTNANTSKETADEIEFISEQWRRLNIESRTLEQRLQMQLPTMKEGFLIQLLQGHFRASDNSELEERMQLFGWETDDMGFAVLGIQLHGSTRSKGRFQKGDQELISFASVNITEEILKDSFLNGEIINFHDLTISVLLSCPQYYQADERRDEIYRLADQLAGMIHRFIQMDVTVCISKLVSSVVEIPQAWEEVSRIVRYRDLNESKQVINAEDYLSQGKDSIRYPFAAESDILQAIHNVNEEESKSALRKFCSELKANTTKEYLFQQGMLQLYGNLQFGFLKAGYNPFETASFNVQEELAQLTDSAEITSFFYQRVIHPYIQKMKQDSEKQDLRLKRAIERIVETIHDKYDSDLSLDLFADEHNLTSLTLSKAFKKTMGINFIIYLTDVRIRKSKELLLETDYKINDIAEMVGYQPTYFNRIFKKNEGITPSQYRESTLISGVGKI
ncbi:AraC family transcriptional regulator [Paenibacillus agricola]|uniref:Helix-turn-helix domain-containing protein n=1 Tax=Paenibacillus agricola TaxID=2716264 RepID=A0ABX0JEE4_9BACL|nr:AraC family transcriptional regulator [Paenibacillus agricola]NHN32070.1 helix-turn-helix domain-containing protein [Paenibacillus agricola]